MKRIAITTATRAEYGLLSPLIKRIEEDIDLELDLIVTGTHLSKRFGHSIDKILDDEFIITHEIPILDDDNSSFGISKTIANSLSGFAKCFKEDRPDLVVVLGDRTEMLGVAIAALNELIPIAHIHGGEITEGAVDDCVRHAITKMSQLHFTSTETYKRRVIQMGERPERVFNVGALGVENILKLDYMDEELMRSDIGIPRGSCYAVVTFHPVTLEKNIASNEIKQLCMAMEALSDVFFLITGANADRDGVAINDILIEFAQHHKNAIFVHNLGTKRYLSAMRSASFVLGNSSSGILEAPALGTPTVNVGDRQKGRIMADTVICCKTDVDEIVNAIYRALTMEHTKSYIYGDGHTSENIVFQIKEFLLNGQSCRKEFYDISF